MIPSSQIPIYRQGIVTSDFLSIFGSNLRETRISAALGFIIARVPDPFLKAFNVSGNLKFVSVEYEESHKRIDILLETGDEYFIIETKISDEDSLSQILKYVSGDTYL